MFKYLGVIRKWIGQRKKNLFSAIESQTDYVPRNADPIFVTGAGRSGTHFLAKLFESVPGVDAYHLDDVGDAIGDSFELFIKWNKIAIANSGFINSRGFLIEKAAKQNARFMESNPLIAFSIEDLFEAFGGRFVIVIRNPRKVVESFYRKGWYSKFYVAEAGVSGYQYFHDRPNHYFSRFTPHAGQECEEWLNAPRLGKIAWMWGATYLQIFNQLKRLPTDSYRFIQLESFTHIEFERLLKFLDIETRISHSEFDQIEKKRPGKGGLTNVLWDESSKKYFNTQVSKVIEVLPKEIRTDGWLFD